MQPDIPFVPIRWDQCIPGHTEIIYLSKPDKRGRQSWKKAMLIKAYINENEIIPYKLGLRSEWKPFYTIRTQDRMLFMSPKDIIQDGSSEKDNGKMPWYVPQWYNIVSVLLGAFVGFKIWN